MVFDLVGGGDDSSLGEELGQVFYGVVGDADGFDFIRVLLVDGFEVLPSVDVGDGVVNVAGAVFVFGEERMVA